MYRVSSDIRTDLQTQQWRLDQQYTDSGDRMSRLKSIRRRMAMFCINHFLAGTHFFNAKRKLLNSAGYQIGNNTKVVGPLFLTGELRVGEDCWIGRDFTVDGNGAVEIGNRCDIAPSVCFFTGTHAIGDHSRRAGTGSNGKIIIQDGCWIGGRASFMNPVTVHAGSVIAACACVCSDIPADVLAGGVPARVIKQLH